MGGGGKHASNLTFLLQVEEEATDKDNKNCSKDGMCSKVRPCQLLTGTFFPATLTVPFGTFPLAPRTRAVPVLTLPCILAIPKTWPMQAGYIATI